MQMFRLSENETLLATNSCTAYCTTRDFMRSNVTGLRTGSGCTIVR